MKKQFNSRHQFDNMADALKFVEAIKGAGFRQSEYAKDGGLIYTNANGYKLIICVK